MTKKSATDSEGNVLSWGDWVAFETAPYVLLNGLPPEDQSAIQAQVDKPLRFEGLNKSGYAELEFGDECSGFHRICVQPKYLVKVKFTKEALTATGTRQGEREKRWRQLVIQAWIKMSQSENRSPEYEKNFWASMLIFGLVEDKPEEAWILIDAIRNATDNTQSLGLLAAGHLEDLLAKHGDQFIERFEAQAKIDEDFARLLGGVWQNDMTDELWWRVRKIRLPPK